MWVDNANIYTSTHALTPATGQATLALPDASIVYSVAIVAGCLRVGVAISAACPDCTPLSAGRFLRKQLACVCCRAPGGLPGAAAAPAISSGGAE